MFLSKEKNRKINEQKQLFDSKSFELKERAVKVETGFTPEVRNDSKWWYRTVKNQAVFHQLPYTHFLTTHAADPGWGAQLKEMKRVSFSWNLDEGTPEMALELERAVRSIRVDSESVVEIFEVSRRTAAIPTSLSIWMCMILRYRKFLVQILSIGR